MSMLSYQAALQQILEKAKLLEVQQVDLLSAQGRVLQETQKASFPLPPWDNSAMDGYAVRHEELPGTLPLDGVVAAGATPIATLKPGTCLKIMTGAPVPDGCTAVVMREEVEQKGDLATFSAAPNPGQHIRKAGEDVQTDSILLPQGTLLGPGELAILAAQGISQVAVPKRPRVVIVSTGNELVPLGQQPQEGQIVNSNAITLAAQVRQAGGIAIRAGIIGDSLKDTVETFRSLQDYDVLISSGGVSVGDFDYVKEAYTHVGIELDFWKVAIKPGKPVAFGQSRNGQLVFGLPGNPASSLVSFELFVRPLLLKMTGQYLPPTTDVILSQELTKKTGRTHFVRAQLKRVDEQWMATPLKRQGSGMLRSMATAHCLLQLHADQTLFPAGKKVPAIFIGNAAQEIPYSR